MDESKRRPFSCRSSLPRRVNATERARFDSGAKAAGYVDVFMDSIRWRNADEAFARLSAHSNRGAGTQACNQD